MAYILSCIAGKQRIPATTNSKVALHNESQLNYTLNESTWIAQVKKWQGMHAETCIFKEQELAESGTKMHLE